MLNIFVVLAIRPRTLSLPEKVSNVGSRLRLILNTFPKNYSASTKILQGIAASLSHKWQN